MNLTKFTIIGLVLVAMTAASQIEVTTITNRVVQRINGELVTNDFTRKVVKPVISVPSSLEENLRAIGTNPQVSVAAIYPVGGTNGVKSSYQIILRPKTP